MSNFNQMPFPPNQNGMAYDMYGNPVPVQTYAPNQPIPQQGYYQQPYYQQPMYQQPAQVIEPPSQGSGLGANFERLIGTNVAVPLTPAMVPAEKKKRKTKASSSSSKEETEIEVVDPKQERISLVEETSYADTYTGTGQLLRSTIAQVDELAGELKVELDKVRQSHNMKGKYTYIANISSAMTGLLGTKVTAIRELNSSIKSINEAEYRRYKDTRSADATDDSKFISDIYASVLRNPVQIPNYIEPSTLDLTAGLNGIIRADSMAPAQRDVGFQGFMSNITPEQNAMIQESNPYIEEVIVYDQASGQKYFDYVDTRNGEHVPNMPVSDPMFMEDYVIDPRTRVAKNSNLRTQMKVIYKNEGSFDEY